MKYTVDSIKRINGNVNDDHKIAGEFCKEAMSEVQDRAKKINDICELSIIVDTNSLSQVRK